MQSLTFKSFGDLTDIRVWPPCEEKGADEDLKNPPTDVFSGLLFRPVYAIFVFTPSSHLNFVT